VKTYKIMEKKSLWFGISLAIIAIGLVNIFLHGLNWGIDFTGGTILQYNIHETYDLQDVRDVLSKFNLKDYDVKKAGDTSQELIIRTVVLTSGFATKMGQIGTDKGRKSGCRDRKGTSTASYYRPDHSQHRYADLHYVQV